MSNQADKRSVATDALHTLGTIIGPDEKRDAIHLAVEPAIAAHPLKAGEDVGFMPDGRMGRCESPVGIVDPFLQVNVKTGQRFWLVVYPRQITSLRHVWEHPAFPSSGAAPVQPVEAVEKAPTDASEQWLRDYAEVWGLSYDKLLRVAENYLEDGSFITGGEELEGAYVSDEFWDHFEKVKGIKVAEDNRGNFFNCSC
jgi:hypothetical protein